MYILDKNVTVRQSDGNVTHILMVNPEDQFDKITACGLTVYPDWRLTLRKSECEEYNARS